ncbi:MAG: 2-hydroxyacid dehydrogenase [Bacteroidia bacterium]|jgi:D-3-phosphoglycerate dehydrogenase|nr:2-hydroxyacid dehydrogenase [Bacteroidia bacterium]
MKRILFLDTNHPVMLEMLRGAGFECDEEYSLSKEEVQQRMSGYHGVVIRSRFKLDAAFINASPDLKCIARAGAGMENIDVAYAQARGIACVHAPEGNRDAVGEQALGMLLALMNNLARADREVRTGKWIREGNRGYELGGKTVGIIGYGNMGSAFAQRLRGFEVNVLAYDKYKTGFGNEFVKESSPEEIFAQADVLSLHIPLTPETEYMVNDAFLSAFRKPLWLINSARGKVLDTAALVKHLQQGTVRGACLDVLEYEKVSFEAIDATALPAPMQYLIQSDKVLLSPHIAGWTFESHEKIGKVLAQKIINALTG